MPKLLFLPLNQIKKCVNYFGLADNIKVINTDSFASFSFSLIKIIFQIRARNYDIAIDMEFFSKFSMIVSYLSGSPVRVGYFMTELWREALITNHVYYNVYRHATENFLALANSIGIDESESKLLSSPKISEKAKEWSKTFVDMSNKLILINVNASELSELRRWPKENFVSLIDMIIEEYNPKIIFIGTEREKDYTDSVIESLNNRSKIINLAGKITLEQLSSLFAVCNLFITNDSGPLHLAVSVGSSTISFFGPETPVLFGPLGEQHKVLYKNLYCSPCLNVYNTKTTKCKDAKCLTFISVEEVYEAVKNILR